MLSPISEAFVQLLAASRDFQMCYLADKSGEYGFEGRDSYGRADGGLPIVFMVAEDSLVRDYYSVLLAEEEESALQGCMFRLCSLVRFIIESGNDTMGSIEWYDGETKDYINGLWELLRHLAVAVLDELGMEVSPPEQSYEDAFLEQCYLLPEEPAA